MNLNNEQNSRYSRHLVMPQIGIEGQQKLLKSRVLIVGAGGLGSPIALYLSAAGVGTLGIIDGDVVDLSNLQRQILHSTPDLAKPKVISAKEKINAINQDVNVIVHQTLFTELNASALIADYDFVIDATDNFATKFLINDSCVKAGKAFSHGGISRMSGQVLTYIPRSACLRCVFDDAPAANTVLTPAQAGVLGAAVGILGSIQATEAIKYLLGIGDLLTNRMMVVDALSMSFNAIQLSPNPDCQICGKH